MPNLALIIISVIITFIAICISIIYCTNKNFRSFPFYFNMMFTISIALNNVIRFIPFEKGEEKNLTILCQIQAFSLTFLDKYMLTLMTVYSVIAYIGSYRIESFKVYQKSIFIILTIISIIISGICTTVFFIVGISGHSEFCYVKTSEPVKQWVDTIVTSILFLINLFCIIRILMKVSQLRKEINQSIIVGRENGFDNHLTRFIIDLIINIIVFVYVILLILKKLPFDSFVKDLIYIISCLVVELFFTLNSELIRYITCQRQNDDMMLGDNQRNASESVYDDDDIEEDN